MTQLTNLVQFPGLGLSFHLNRVAFSIGGVHIYWYGVCIAVGLCLALVFAFRHSIEFGVDPDGMVDVILIGVVLGIVSARAYYVAMAPFQYQSIWEMIAIRDGGLAIYGGVIMAVVVLLVFCKVRQIRFLAFADLGVFGMLIGQMIGRWGNFVNIEAYGGPTELPWRMGIYAYVDGVRQYMEVHPTFLYESLWNLLGFALLVQIARRWRKFDGQMFLSYFAWYGVGRGFIEGLRTDSLYLFGTSIRVSQLFGFATAAIAIVLLVINLGFRNHDPAKLWVNQMKRRARRVALVYPAGVPAAEKWLKAQKKSLEQEFAKTEEYALPKGTPAEETAELVASLKAREDLSEVRQPKAGR